MSESFSPWKDLEAPLIVTFAGTIAGFFIALYHDRRTKKNEQNENKFQALISLREDLKQTKGWIETKYHGKEISWNQIDKEFNGIWPIFSFPSYDNIVQSGTLSLLTHEFQMLLYGLKSQFDTISKFTDQILNFHLSPLYIDDKYGYREAERITGQLNGRITKLKENIQNALPEIEKLLPEKYRK